MYDHEMELLRTEALKTCAEKFLEEGYVGIVYPQCDVQLMGRSAEKGVEAEHREKLTRYRVFLDVTITGHKDLGGKTSEGYVYGHYGVSAVRRVPVNGVPENYADIVTEKYVEAFIE